MQTNSEMTKFSTENEVPATPPKHFARIRRVCLKVRNKLEKWRTNNPKMFDGLVRTIEVAWFFFNTFLVSGSQNIFVTVLLMSITFGLLYFAQWALLTNKLEREIEKVTKTEEIKYDALLREKTNEIKSLENQYTNEIRELQTQKAVEIKSSKLSYRQAIPFAHLLAHNIKIAISQMPYQNMGVVRSSIIGVMTEGLNSFEDILTHHYQRKICASIKLCISEECVKTYARGENNVANRGGKSKVKNLNKKEIHINSNYAYRAIVQRQLQYFAEGDLNNLHEKEEDNDVFFCEYGGKWEDMFQASIVIPIRYPIIVDSTRESDSTMEYKMLGLICVDAKKPIAEWSNPDKSFAYHLTAFFADVLYTLLDQYETEQIRRKGTSKIKGTKS